MRIRYSKVIPLLLCLACGRRENKSTPAILSYVATVNQFGPVAYRDPLAAVSPDGAWLATARGRHVAVQRIVGGPVAELDTAGLLKSSLSWLPDSRHLAVLETAGMSDSAEWVVYDVISGLRAPLWPDRATISGRASDSGGAGHAPRTLTIAPSQLRQLAWSPDGRAVAGVVERGDRPELWIMAADPDSARVQSMATPVSHPAWTPDSRHVACVLDGPSGPRVSLPCGAAPDPEWRQDVYGSLAFSPDGARMYYATPNNRGTLDLWSRELARGGRARQLTHFSRDTYAPSTSIDGRVLFKLQEYTTSVAEVSAGGGAVHALTAFMSETPLWDWSGTQLAVTYGNWRRVTDDAHYPNIAQDVGIVRLDVPMPARAPNAVVQASPAEDQGFCWSPNGRWIAFHSHQQQSDDIWLEPADRSAAPRQISVKGLETGWPRWSRDGHWIAYPSHTQAGGVTRAALYVVGVDQATGVTGAPRAVALAEPITELVHAEWMPDGSHLVVETGDPASAEKVLYVVGRTDGRMRRILTFRSEQLESGIALSPDGRAVAYVAPAADGFFQIFAVPVAGGRPRQVTTDPTDKTQPAWSPDGSQIAFTVWSYKARIFMTAPDRVRPRVKKR